MENGKKELNLTDVLILCGKGLKEVFLFCIRAIGWCLQIIYQKKWFLLCFLAIGIIIGFISGRTDNSYKAGFTMSVYVKSPYFCSRIVESIDKNCGKETLAEMLEVDSATAAQIKSIKPYFIVDINQDSILDFVDYEGKYKLDTLVKTWSKQYLYVEMEADNDSIFPLIQERVLHYICQDKVLQEELAIQKRIEEDWVNVLHKEMDQVMAIQEKIFSAELTPSLQMERAGVLTNMFGVNQVQMFWGGKVYLMEKICPHSILLDRYEKGPVQVEFPMETIEKDSNISSKMITYGILGFLLGFVLTVYLKFRKNILAYLNKK